MSMKEALENYFKRLESSCQNKNGCMPKTVYVEKCDLHGIYIKGSLDQEGYAEWKPILQNQFIDFEQIEKELGFKINEQIKKFFTTYWFMQMYGNYNGNECYFNKIVPNADIRDIILKSHHSGNIDYMKPYNYFHIGDVDNIDHEDCGLYVENSTCKVVGIDWNGAMDCDFSKPLSEFMFKICDSLEELIDTMEVK